MNQSTRYSSLPILVLIVATVAVAQEQRQPPTPSQSIESNFASVNARVLAMAQDFPAEKYDYRPTKDVRSFGEVIVHILSGNVFAAKAGRGEKASWDEVDPKTYKNKAEIVSALQKSIDDSTASLKAIPAERFTKTLSPWLAVIEHGGEHYGQLVVYYRLNGMVPPESRPKPKS
jgi:uncharacterized damage-inducible protein DinB